MKIALTGVTGNMGSAALKELVNIEEISHFKLLVLPDDKKRIKKLLRGLKAHKNKFEVIYGNIADENVCAFLVKDVDYVVNMAAVIPPHSDQYPEKAIECNEVGVDKLVTAIENAKPQPKLIHISTVALYGNRNYLRPWARVGDPLLVSPFDIYSATKLRGEFRVLESSIENFAVLRQSAMLHNNMMSDNLHDGLMFHTCFNAPLEWVTAHDSGVLIANIIRRDMKEDLSKTFWRKCFNIGSVAKNRITGFNTLDDGFKMMGASAKDFFEPNYNATRNFHGVWFYDGEKLEELFKYQSEDTDYFWQTFLKKHSYFKLGKLCPKGLIKKFAIKRLFKSENAARYWVEHNDEAKVFAYFGGESQYKRIPKTWDKFNLLVENKGENSAAVDFEALRQKENAKLVDLKFNPDKEITIKDLKAVAEAHGGKLLSKKFEGLYDKLEWENSDGEKFEARAYTILGAGHWLNCTYKEYAWDFDRLAKTDAIYAQVWYESHVKNEDKFYYLDKNFEARIKNL